MSQTRHLKEVGLKATAPRLTILNLFEKTTVQHLSAEEVYKILLAEKQDIGLATIYRVLTQFEEAGILSRHHFEEGRSVFELNKGHHHDHLVCVECGLVIEFVDQEIERRQNEIATQHHFIIADHALYLYGICEACQTDPARVVTK